jgi:hypothetical protein
LLLSGFATAMLLGLACHRAGAPASPWVHGSRTEIVGPEEFKTQVALALELLRSRSPDSYEIVLENVGRIQAAERSGMLPWRDPPTFELGRRTAFYSPTWCATSIVHDAYHAKLYLDHQRAHGDAPPAGIWTGTDAERACIAAQIRAAEAIGAPWHELDHLRKADGTHWDANRDGVMDHRDYRARDW